jgi:hypothetical protein
MSYRDVSQRNAVLHAIEEFDALGRNAFLVKYGFGRARTYFLIHAGKQYDSKALLGVAHGYQFGTPLTPSNFSGGKNTVRPKLESLGFQVVAHQVDEKTSALPEEVPEDIWEGARYTVKVNAYERSAAARLACIEHHGTACIVCGFDFAAAYGEQFAGFIHVHHVTPLSKVNARYKVNPQTDLVPVCANCHAIIHYGGKTRAIEAMRKLFKGKPPNKTLQRTR